MSKSTATSNEIVQIRKRSMGVMLVLMLLFVLSFILIDYLKVRSELVKERHQVSEKVIQLFESEKSRLVSFFSTRVKCHLASPLAIEAMESKDAELIYKYAKPKFDILNSRNPYVTHMHFYAPDGTSLMRVHNKEVYGDKISEKRPMVAYAVENQASVSGFEEGYFGLIFRIVEPAYNKDGEYIGSLEFGLQPQYFETVIKGLFPDMKVTLAISKYNLSIYEDTGRFESHNNHFLVGDDIDLLKPYIGQPDSENEKSVDVNGRKHILMNNIILKDFADKPFIQMYLLKDVQGLQNKFVETIYFSVVIGFLLLVVLWLATKFVFSQFTRSVIALSDELSESHAKMASVFNTTNEGLAVLDSEGRFIEVNKAFNDIFEQSTSELLNLKFQDVFPELWAAIEERKPVNVGYRTPQGSDKSLEVSFHLMDGHSLTLLACKDITQLRKQQIEIENYIKVVDDNVITSKADLHGIITYASAAFCRTSGYEKDELIGQKHSIIRHPDMPSKVFDDMWYTITKGKTWQGEVKNLKKDGTAYWVATSISADRDERNKIVGYTAIRQDITDKKQVELLSITDELTGLKNRRYYNMVFESEYSRRQRENKPFLFVLLDLDHFKRYNDHYGHQKGDMVLAEFSDCIRQCFKRSGDILFRLGGEEFAGILQIQSAVEAQDLVDKVNQELEVLNVEHVTNSVKNHVTVSIGGVVITDYSRGYLEKDIYRMADEALYLAKSQGRNQAVIKRL